MKSLFFLIAATVILVGCAAPEPDSPTGSKTAGGGKESAQEFAYGDYKLGEPITRDNVTIVPVSLVKTDAKTLTQDSDTLTLAEAKKLGVIEIIERPGEEEVNSLKVRNTGDRPILLLGGDLLLGGKQDRIVAKDVIVPPRSTVDVGVYCVEHGRWSGNSQHFDYSMSSVPTKVRDAATFGDQDKVWESVAEYNVSAGHSADSDGTVMKGISSEKVQAALAESLPKFSEDLGRGNNVVGAILVVNGQIQTMDLFESSRLFQASRDSLLKGYLSQAATSAKATKAVSLKECLEFLTSSLSATAVYERSQSGGVTLGSNASAKGAVLRGFQPDSKLESKAIHGVYSPNK
jgi:hypothetical protein